MSAVMCKKCKTLKAPFVDCPNCLSEIHKKINPTVKNQILYAFWNYDLCPYVLGGRVKSFTSDGGVRIEGMPGMIFKPIAILPDKAGMDALEMIREIAVKFKKEEQKLKDKYRNEAKFVLGLLEKNNANNETSNS